MGLFTSQPGKAVWVLLAVCANLVRFPWLFIYYIPSSTRPHASWTWRQAVRVQLIKSVLWHMAFVNMQTPLSLRPRAEKERWAVVEPAADRDYVAAAAIDPAVRPVSLGATWYPVAPRVRRPAGIVVLHFHGGAFVIGDGRTKDAGFAAKTLLQHTDADAVFAPQYRLSGNPGGTFPAALQDAITAYAHLVRREGIAAERIVLSGDSAGGNLVLALVRYLTEHGAAIGLGLPRCAWLWSPWVSPRRSLDSVAFDASPNAGSDYVTAAFGHWGARLYAPRPQTGIDLAHPYICFYDNATTLATPVPLYVSTGECEVLFHDDVKLAEELRAVPGNRVELSVEENCVHDIILIGKIIGFEAEAARAAKRANAFLQSLGDSKPSKR